MYQSNCFPSAVVLLARYNSLYRQWNIRNYSTPMSEMIFHFCTKNRYFIVSTCKFSRWMSAKQLAKRGRCNAIHTPCVASDWTHHFVTCENLVRSSDWLENICYIMVFKIVRFKKERVNWWCTVNIIWTSLKLNSILFLILFLSLCHCNSVVRLVKKLVNYNRRVICEKRFRWFGCLRRFEKNCDKISSIVFVIHRW